MPDHPYLVSTHPGRWSLRLDPAELRAAMDGWRAAVAQPGGAVLSLTDDTGVHYDHATLCRIGEDAARMLEAAATRTRRRWRALRADDLVTVAGASQTLTAVASLTIEAGGACEPLLLLAGAIASEATIALDRRFVPRGDGTFDTSWPATDRLMIDALATEVEASLASGDDDPDLVRLFPPAYGTDEARSAEFAAVARDDLAGSRRAALATLRDAMTRDTATADEMAAIMRAVNDLRLVLGTRLDVSEEGSEPDDDHPDAAAYAMYQHLTHLLAQVLDALRRA